MRFSGFAVIMMFLAGFSLAMWLVAAHQACPAPHQNEGVGGVYLFHPEKCP